MKGKILLHVTGSIAAFKAAALASKLVQAGYSVKTVLTRGAQDFIGKGTFEGLTGERVWTDLFDDGSRMDHIHLARWSDLQIVYPCSAETIAKLRAGRADDLTGALHLAREREKPYWIAPAMNPEMISSPAVRENVAKLAEWGVRILNGESGRTACGEYGTGRLIEPEAALQEIESWFGSAKRGDALDLRGRRILVTAGGTYEPLDPVRGLTNVSTGETGVRVAEGLARDGADVTLLLARNALFTPIDVKGLRTERFQTFDDLDTLLSHELRSESYDVCVHAAAVGDFRVERIEATDGTAINGGTSGTTTEKIATGEGLRVTLSPRKKLVAEVKALSKNPAIRLISFKLAAGQAVGAETQALHAVRGYADSDLVIHNVATEVERGTERHRARFFVREGTHASSDWKLAAEAGTKSAIVAEIARTIADWRTK